VKIEVPNQILEKNAGDIKAIILIHILEAVGSNHGDGSVFVTAHFLSYP
jgi:hypothetical protein